LQTYAEVAVLGGSSGGAEHGGNDRSSASASNDLTAVGREGHLFEAKKKMEKPLEEAESEKQVWKNDRNQVERTVNTKQTKSCCKQERGFAVHWVVGLE
jgi:hypothetical protein